MPQLFELNYRQINAKNPNLWSYRWSFSWNSSYTSQDFSIKFYSSDPPKQFILGRVSTHPKKIWKFAIIKVFMGPKKIFITFFIVRVTTHPKSFVMVRVFTWPIIFFHNFLLLGFSKSFMNHEKILKNFVRALENPNFRYLYS